MRSFRNLIAGACMAGLLFVAQGCDDDDDNGTPLPGEPSDTTGPDTTGTDTTVSPATIRLQAVLPRDSAETAAFERFQVVFSGAVAEGAEDYVDVHSGSVSGPVVNTNCSLSSTGAIINCTPAIGSTFEAGQTYVVHVGGGLRGFNGGGVDLTTLGSAVGGTIVREADVTAGVHPAGTDSVGLGWAGDSTSQLGIAFPVRFF